MVRGIQKLRDIDNSSRRWV